ncbi:cobalt-precorrin-6A reductase [Aquamicrobium sp. LC103]|uniref:cobalt-precorrin-6A reductase n=1 Tax=Aquamicrobium sp. LC103 TaxID=1120658 RepID=UPI00063E72EE|nr:cobalt-precorrin-6A reductase [Aquamicrobium sp. LC103]TKT76694.1 cobalt-precorrin-6A reductase [Aquamicrobium sp. LC103]
MTHRILILGGTTEARQLSRLLGEDGRYDVTLSLAGRTRAPAAHAVPVRVGGFGGAEGLAGYLREYRTDILVDATHPFAARISGNAAVAAALAGVPLLVLRRPEWRPVEGDRWIEVDGVAQAVAALGTEPRGVFVALGRQELAPLEAAPWHRYVIRSVDPVEPPLALPAATYLLARGPFGLDDELALFERHRVEAVLAKNSGGEATYSKLEASRKLGIEVFLVRRPALPEVASAATPVEAMTMVSHLAVSLAKRGV